MSLIRVPFAESGDKNTVPVAAQSDGSVSYVQGYPLAYSLDPETDAGAKRIERLKMNQLFFDITSAIQEIQQNGVKPFITAGENGGSAFSYGIGALTMLNGTVYQSLTAANTGTPGSSPNWAPLANSINSVPVITQATASDLNLITTTGIYGVTAAAANAPLAQTAVLEHYERVQGSARVQVWHCVSASAGVSNTHFIRTGTGAPGSVVWTGWLQLASTADVATRAALNGNVANDFAVRNSGDANNAVNNARLEFRLGSYALVGGNVNQRFGVADPSAGGDAVNLNVLNTRLAQKADVSGNQFTPFNVGGATQGTQAVRLDQFQSGNNVNGAWVKLPGGGQWSRFNVTIPAKSNYTWTFPTGFASTPAVFITSINGQFDAWLTGVGPNNAGIYNNRDQPVNFNLLAMY